MKNKSSPLTYDQIVRTTIKELSQPHVSGDIETIVERLKRAAQSSFKPLDEARRDLSNYYSSLYRRVIKKNNALLQVKTPRPSVVKGKMTVATKFKGLPKPTGPGIKEINPLPQVGRYTLANLTLEAQEELQKKIISSIELIKLNREVAVAETTKRLVGWVSSIPPEGTEVKVNVEKEKIVKALKQLPYVEKRVIIDQGHKLVSSLENIVSKGSGAIAAKWHSHVHQAGYNYRHSHAAMDGKIYLIQDSWADKEGLVKAVNGYTNGHEMPAELVNCRCYYSYLFNLKDLPLDMLTKKAQDLLSHKEHANV